MITLVAITVQDKFCFLIYKCTRLLFVILKIVFKYLQQLFDHTSDAFFWKLEKCFNTTLYTYFSIFMNTKRFTHLFEHFGW